jgi:hypothetical protein
VFQIRGHGLRRENGAVIFFELRGRATPLMVTFAAAGGRMCVRVAHVGWKLWRFRSERQWWCARRVVAGCLFTAAVRDRETHRLAVAHAQRMTEAARSGGIIPTNTVQFRVSACPPHRLKRVNNPHNPPVNRVITRFEPQ